MRCIILDTNVLVSALVSAKGNESLVLRHALSGEFEVGVSPPILSEYRLVLERPKFKISRAKLDELFSQLEAHARLVDPVDTVNASPDEGPTTAFSNARETLHAEFTHHRETSGIFPQSGGEQRNL